jgi:hypothetical protein
MIIKLLSEKYIRSEEAFLNFKYDKPIDESNYLDETVEIEGVKPFPIYMGINKIEDVLVEFLEAFHTFKKWYVSMEQDIYMDQSFWFTLLLTEFRDYIVDKYPRSINNIKAFHNIVIKKFDWENYIYKTALMTQYIVDNAQPEFHDHYVTLITENLDIFNYCLKYKITRNDKFLIMILNIIDRNKLSKTLKSKVKHMKKDNRYGRLVIFELNKRYPTYMFHGVEEKELEVEFINILNAYREHGE